MKNFFKVCYSIFFYTFLLASFFLGTLLAFLAASFAPNKQRVFQKAARIWARILIFITGHHVAVEGLENLPTDTAFVLASNHQSMADIIILLANIPVYFKFVAKRELFRVPVFGAYLKLAGYIPIDRQKSLTAHKTLYDTSKLLKKGDSILIFPEGTRSYTGELGPFKRGSLVIAKEAGVPIVPVAISGSFTLVPRGSFLINLGKVKLSIGEPIPVDPNDMDKTINKVRSKILSMLKD